MFKSSVLQLIGTIYIYIYYLNTKSPPVRLYYPIFSTCFIIVIMIIPKNFTDIFRSR